MTSRHDDVPATRRAEGKGPRKTSDEAGPDSSSRSPVDVTTHEMPAVSGDKAQRPDTTSTLSSHPPPATDDPRVSRLRRRGGDATELMRSTAAHTDGTEFCQSEEASQARQYRAQDNGNRSAKLHSSSHTIPRPHRVRTGRRDPLARYALLSVTLVIVGLVFRYLWRQLAGLAGAVLILTVARKTAGKERKRSNPSAPTFSTKHRSATGTGTGAASQGSSVTAERGENVADQETGRFSATRTGASKAVVDTDEIKTALRSSDATSSIVDSTDEAYAKAALEYGGAFADSPLELRRCWKDGGPSCSFFVRGSSYMSDRKKVPAGPAAMKLVHMDLFTMDGTPFHVASRGRCRDRIARFVKSFQDEGKEAPFLFLLNILVPGTPDVSTVMYWAMEYDGDSDGMASETGSETDGASTHKKFLDMLQRYAEVPGSDYLGFERERPPPLPASSPAANFSASDRNPGARGGPNGFDEGVAGLASVSGSIKNEHYSKKGSDPLSKGPGSPVQVPSSEMEEALAEVGVGATPAERIEKAVEQGVGDGGLLPLDDFRNQRFKLIPSIVSGPFMVRKAVGNKPALLGRKLRQRYFRGDGYVETDVDVGSSMVAAKIVGLCRGYARSLCVEIGICLEGRSEAELPEKCIGVVQLINLDLDRAEPLEPPPEDTFARTCDEFHSSQEGIPSGFERENKVEIPTESGQSATRLLVSAR